MWILFTCDLWEAFAKWIKFVLKTISLGLFPLKILTHTLNSLQVLATDILWEESCLILCLCTYYCIRIHLYYVCILWSHDKVHVRALLFRKSFWCSLLCGMAYFFFSLGLLFFNRPLIKYLIFSTPHNGKGTGMKLIHNIVLSTNLDAIIKY